MNQSGKPDSLQKSSQKLPAFDGDSRLYIRHGPNSKPPKADEGSVPMWLVAAASVAGNLPVRISERELVIGRSKQAQIVICDPTVSRKHARLIHCCHELVLEDLDSANGTFVDNHRIGRCSISIGDHIRVGGVNCAISCSPLTLEPHGQEESTFCIRRPPGDTAQFETFTPAQQEIITKLMEGRREGEIAAMLGRSPHTIHTHLKAIFRRMGVHSRAELMVKLIKDT